MPVFTTPDIGQEPVEFLLCEGPGTLSRDRAVLVNGVDVVDGQPLMASGANVTAWDGGSGDVVGLAIGAHSGDGATAIAYIARYAEVKATGLKYVDETPDGEAALIEALALNDIIVRGPFNEFEEPSEVVSESASAS